MNIYRSRSKINLITNLPVFPLITSLYSEGALIVNLCMAHLLFVSLLRIVRELVEVISPVEASIVPNSTLQKKVINQFRTSIGRIMTKSVSFPSC